GRSRAGEVDDTIRLGKSLQRIVTDRDAKRTDASKIARILPDEGRALALDGAGNDGTRRLMNGAHQRTAHSPSGTDHDKFHAHASSPMTALMAAASTDPCSACRL